MFKEFSQLLTIFWKFLQKQLPNQIFLKVDVKAGDTIDVFCSNTDIEFRTDYNSAKFSGWLIKQK